MKKTNINSCYSNNFDFFNFRLNNFFLRGINKKIIYLQKKCKCDEYCKV